MSSYKSEDIIATEDSNCSQRNFSVTSSSRLQHIFNAPAETVPTINIPSSKDIPIGNKLQYDNGKQPYHTKNTYSGLISTNILLENTDNREEEDYNNRAHSEGTWDVSKPLPELLANTSTFGIYAASPLPHGRRLNTDPKLLIGTLHPPRHALECTGPARSHTPNDSNTDDPPTPRTSKTTSSPCSQSSPNPTKKS